MPVFRQAILLALLLVSSLFTLACPNPGTYRIGATGDYQNITQAIQALTPCPINGAYIFEFQADYSSSTETFPIVVPAISGASSTHTITFRPAVGVNVSIVHSGSGVLLLQGADYVVFDGRPGGMGTAKNLLFENTLVGNAYAVQFVNDATNNTFRYCQLRSASNVNTTGTVFFNNTNGTTGNDDNLIEFCSISDASTGTPLNGIYARGSLSSGVTAYNSGNQIRNNEIFNFYSATAGCNGIFLDGGNTLFNIERNSFYQTTNRVMAATRGYAAVFVFDNGVAGGTFSIADNFIGGNSANASGTQTISGGGVLIPIQVYAGTSGTTLIARNRIRNIQYSSNATSPSLQRVIGIFRGTVTASENIIESIDYTWSGTNMILSAISAGISTGYQGSVVITSNTIQNINYNVTGATSPRIWMIYFIDNPSSFTISQNTITNITTNANNTFRGIAGLSTGNNNLITQNLISNLTQTSTGTAAQLSGIWTQNSRSFTITENQINRLTTSSSNAGTGANSALAGIHLQSAGTSHAITGNLISDIRGTQTGAVNTQVQGIATNSTASGGNIAANRIWNLSNAATGTGAQIAGMMPNGGSWIISNNMIALTNLPHTNNMIVSGIFDGGSAGTRAYYHQTIYVGGTNGGNANAVGLQFNSNTGASAHVLNNLIQVERAGGTGKYYCLANIGPASGGLVSNYNILNNVNPATLARGAGSTDYDFEGWQTASSGDSYSYTDIPVVFTNLVQGDLHLQSSAMVSPSVVESRGATTTVVTDIDGQVRPGPSALQGGGTMPDIGADEVDITPDNVAPQISFIPLSTPTCLAARTLTARITDHTGVPVNGARVPRLYFRQAAGSWTSVAGILASGNRRDATWQFTLDPAALGSPANGDLIEYYIAAEDIVRIDPNVGATPSTGFAATDVQSILQFPNNSNTITLDDNVQGIWLGLSSNWHQAGNWCGGIPDLTRDAVVSGSAAFLPVISTTANVRHLTIDPQASVQVSAPGTLNLSGDLVNNGQLDVTGRLAFSGTTQGQRLAGSGTFNPIEKLVINNSSGLGVQLERNLTILESFSPTAGVVTLNNATITLRSTPESTARVAAVGDSFLYVGNSRFVVERYFPARRAWRLVTAPLHSTGTIFDHWQEGAPTTYQPGVGTFITGRNPSGAAGNGLDWSAQNNFSMRQYINNAYVDVTNTKTPLSGAGAKAANQSYFLFIRGDRRRSPDNTLPANSNATTLRSAGQLQTGSQTFSINNQLGTYALVGNPYASPVDFNELTKNNVYPRRFYTFDPSFGQVGAFVVMEDIDGDGVFTPSNLPSAQQNNHIQSGQAFFVQPDEFNTTSLIEFRESSKSEISTNSGFRPAGQSPFAQLRADLYYRDDAGNPVLADGALVEFAARFSARVDIEDALKFSNVNENAGWWRAGKLLAVERRPMPVDSDTLFVRTSRLTPRSYTWRIQPMQLDMRNMIAVWQDRFTGNEQVLEGNQPTAISIEITNQAGSAAADRFRIVFRKLSDYFVAKASTTHAGIELSWRSNARSPLTRFVVERSLDSVHFAPVGEQVLLSTTDYRWLDDRLAGAQRYYYRIVAMADQTVLWHSEILSANWFKQSKQPYVFPNPAPSDKIRVYVGEQPAGNYVFHLMDMQGRTLWSESLTVQPGTFVVEISCRNRVASGQYQLLVQGKSRVTIPVQIQ